MKQELIKIKKLIDDIESLINGDKVYADLDIWSEAKEAYHNLVKESACLPCVSQCACPPLVACEVCGEEKNLDGDFWENKKKHDC